MEHSPSYSISLGECTSFTFQTSSCPTLQNSCLWRSQLPRLGVLRSRHTQCVSVTELCGSGVKATPPPSREPPPHRRPTSSTFQAPSSPTLWSLSFPECQGSIWNRLNYVALGRGAIFPSQTLPVQRPSFTWPDLVLFGPDKLCWPHPDDSS